MKRHFFILILLTFATLLLNAENFQVSENSLYDEIKISSESKFYPGVIEKTGLLQKYYPKSVYLADALMLKAEALINIKQNTEAKSVLKRLEKSYSEVIDKTRFEFLFAMAEYGSGNNDKALVHFYNSCRNSKTDGNQSLYNKAVFYAAKIYFAKEDYVSALPLFEQSASNGNYFSKSEYDEIAQKLMLSYNRTGKFSAAQRFYSKLDRQAFSTEVYAALTFYAAQSYEGEKKYQLAYDYYCRVIEFGDQNLAVPALKKAFILSDEKKVNANPGDIFEKSAVVFADFPDFVNEFWLRLGIDEYNKKNYVKSLEYFSHADSANLIRLIYETKISVITKNNIEDAEKSLLSVQQRVPKSLSDSYYAALLECSYALEKWNEIPARFSKIQNPDKSAKFINAAFFYNKGDYKSVVQNIDEGVLYASALAKLGEYQKSKKAFEESLQLSSLSEEFSLEYAKVLFYCGEYENCFNTARKIKKTESSYLCALCRLNQENWKEAKNGFISYIKTSAESKNEKYNQFALFYKGYCEYSLEDYKNSYLSFVRYTSEAPQTQKKYIRIACELAAKSALLNRDYENAGIQAKNAINASFNDEQKQSAILLAANIYSDMGKFEEAAAILDPYTKGNSDFAASALFALAGIYERQNNLEAADKTYKTIVSRFSRTRHAQTAMFRNGEIYYAKQDYSNALTCFNNYVYKYANGDYSAAALFYAGDSSFRLGQFDKSVMFNTTLLRKFPDSTYTYGSLKNLMEAYYEQQAFKQAAETAQKIVKDFPEQAADDGIGKKLVQLEKLVSGEDLSISEKYAQYEAAGGTKTREGRHLGTELVALYKAKNTQLQTAVNLAQEIYKAQFDSKGNVLSGEQFDSARNGEFLADYFRLNNDAKQAATLYLKAAENYRISSTSSERSVTCLYSAAESFAAAGLYGDARATADLLKQLYPESRQAQSVERILDRY